MNLQVRLLLRWASSWFTKSSKFYYTNKINEIFTINQDGSQAIINYKTEAHECTMHKHSSLNLQAKQTYI